VIRAGCANRRGCASGNLALTAVRVRRRAARSGDGVRRLRAARRSCRRHAAELTAAVGSPSVPKPAQAGPDKAICRAEARTPVRGRQNGELVSEGEILQDQISTGFQGTEQGCRKSEGEIRHCPEVLPERAPDLNNPQADGVLTNDRRSYSQDSMALRNTG